jgi:hypothetical protein
MYNNKNVWNILNDMKISNFSKEEYMYLLHECNDRLSPTSDDEDDDEYERHEYWEENYDYTPEPIPARHVFIKNWGQFELEQIEKMCKKMIRRDWNKVSPVTQTDPKMQKFANKIKQNFAELDDEHKVIIRDFCIKHT